MQGNQVINLERQGDDKPAEERYGREIETPNNAKMEREEKE
jgi:hypothetical protein